MPAERRTRAVEARIENVLAMFPRGLAVIHDQRDDDIARVRLAVGNVFSPAARAHPVTIDTRRGIAAIAAAVAEATAGLIGAMIRRGAAHSGGNSERLDGLRVAEEADRFVDCVRAFFGAETRAAGQDHHVTDEAGAQLFEVLGVSGGISARRVHLADDGGGTGMAGIFLCESDGSDNRQRCN